MFGREHRDWVCWRIVARAVLGPRHLHHQPIAPWSDHTCRYVCLKERNLLMTEMGFDNVPRDMNEQKTRGIAPGTDFVERNQHRIRYTEASGGAQARGGGGMADGTQAHPAWRVGMCLPAQPACSQVQVCRRQPQGAR